MKYTLLQLNCNRFSCIVYIRREMGGRRGVKCKSLLKHPFIKTRNCVKIQPRDFKRDMCCVFFSRIGIARRVGDLFFAFFFFIKISRRCIVHGIIEKEKKISQWNYVAHHLIRLGFYIDMQIHLLFLNEIEILHIVEFCASFSAQSESHGIRETARIFRTSDLLRRSGIFFIIFARFSRRVVCNKWRNEIVILRDTVY